MKQALTAKLKLHTTPEQFKQLRDTQLAYRDALNYVSRYAFAHGKTSSNLTMHRGCYQEIRVRFHLPSQMACSVERDVASQYKGLWTKLMKNREQRKAGYTRKRFKGLDQAPKFVSPTLLYQYGKDFSFKKEQQVSILTLSGRLVVPYQGYDQHLASISKGAEIGAARLWYDQPRKQFYLLVTIEVECPDPTPEQQTQVVGVDVGIRYLAVTSDDQGKATFHSGKRVRARANHDARLRKRLQKKGTRAATRRLKAISGRERRLKMQANHTLSKRIIAKYPHVLIGIEQLHGIRERTKQRKRRHKKNGKGSEPVSVKARKANRISSQWSFAELHGMLAYKAVLSGSMVVRVDADYTSKGCPKCGQVCDENRPRKGLLFRCVTCRYTLHADLVGARNIVLRTLVVRQDWATTGQLSVAPEPSGSDASANEAKAARLRRYAGLRGMPEVSSSPSRGLSI
ncbi:MAG TPA: transposase [Ktedonobacteraceae bacterium]|jgi:IS605 OrfB family transposase